MILAADIGNTSIRLGLFEGKALKHRFKLSADRAKSADEYAVILSGILAMNSLEPTAIESAIVASVVPPLTYTFGKALESFGIPTRSVGSGIRTGLNIRTEQPGALGADIVCNAVAALKLAKPPIAVIDLGTATTLTAINSRGELCGCVIAPGVRLSLDALSEKCSLLPEVSLDEPTRLLGKTSADSLRSGSVLGTALMLDGFIKRISDELAADAQLSVIATGGLCELIIPHCESEIKSDPDLTLRGLAALCALNSRN